MQISKKKQKQEEGLGAKRTGPHGWFQEPFLSLPQDIKEQERSEKHAKIVHTSSKAARHVEGEAGEAGGAKDRGVV